MDLQEVAWESMDWIDVADDWDRLQAFVNGVMNFRVTLNAGNFLTS
jgi:hypothetical protein